MVLPELRDIYSPDLEPPARPDDPADCAVEFRALIGPGGGDGAEAFAFTVVTPAYLSRLREPAWGRGSLIVPVFDWKEVVTAVARLLAGSARPSWPEVTAELACQLRRDGGGRESGDGSP